MRGYIHTIPRHAVRCRVGCTPYKTTRNVLSSIHGEAIDITPTVAGTSLRHKHAQDDSRADSSSNALEETTSFDVQQSRGWKRLIPEASYLKSKRAAATINLKLNDDDKDPVVRAQHMRHMQVKAKSATSVSVLGQKITPSRLEILKEHESEGTLGAKKVFEALWKLLPDLINQQSHEATRTEHYDISQDEFFNVWEVLFRNYGVKQLTSETSSPSSFGDEIWKQNLSYVKRVSSDGVKSQDELLKSVFPTFREDFRHDLALIAVASFIYSIMDPQLRHQSQRLASILAYLLERDDLSVAHQVVARLNGRLSSSTKANYTRLLFNYPLYAEMIIAFSSGARSFTDIVPSQRKLLKHLKSKLHHDISLGIAPNLSETLRHWRDIFLEYENHWPSPQHSRIYSTKLARNLIIAAYKNGEPGKAELLWDEMNSKGFKLGLEEYTLRIQGAGAMKKLSEVEKWWDKLCEAHRPNSIAWYTRIMGYIQCKEPQKAVDLFMEMTNMWIQATEKSGLTDFRQQKSFPNAPKPNAYMVVSLLKALSKVGAHKHILEVIQRTDDIGIRLSAHFFNTLMNARDRHDGPEALLEVLAEMSRRNIAPNRVTYNILINSMYRQPENASTDQQIAKAKELLKDMEKNNISMGLDTLGTYLKLVLWKHNDLHTAMEIFMDANSRFKKMDPILVTTFLSKLFEKPTETNLALILMLRNQVAENPNEADTKLMGQFASGYASIDRIDDMTEILSEMHVRSMNISWVVLHECLLAAVRNSAWQDVRRLVTIARMKDDPQFPGLKEQGHKTDFRNLVAQCDVLGASEESIKSPRGDSVSIVDEQSS